MEVRDLKYIEASAAAANFTYAAKSLGVNTSTISRRVGRLEDELGLALFERGSGGIRLTRGGKALLPHVRRALAELDAIKLAGIQNGNGLAGEVRLAVRMPPVGEPVCSLLADWRQRHREVSLTICEMNELEIQAAIRERRRCRADDAAYAVGRCRYRTALSRAAARGATARPPARAPPNHQLGHNKT